MATKKKGNYGEKKKKCEFEGCGRKVNDWDVLCDEHTVFVDNVKAAMAIIEAEKESD